VEAMRWRQWGGDNEVEAVGWRRRADSGLADVYPV
jgi:hypothetical protein